MSAGFGAFAAKMGKAPEQLAITGREMVRVAALAVTTAERATLAQATHGSNRLRGVGRSGANLSVGFDIKGTGNPTALVRARGPWHLIEEKTTAHVIAPKRGRAVVAGRFGPLAVVNHPGTRQGKHPWAKGLDVGAPAAAVEANAAALAGIAKVFL